MKKLWNKNRVLFVLIMILIVCFISIVLVALTFFYSKDASPYGTRLNNVKKYPITQTDKDKYKDKVIETKHVKKVSINIKVRTIYIKIEFDNDISLEDAKAVAEDSLKLISKKNLKYYDVEFILQNDDFTIFGAKNSVIDHVSWNNNTKIEKDEDDDNNEE